MRDLLAVRRREIVPRLAGASFAAARLEASVLIADWSLGRRRYAEAARQSLRRRGRPAPQLSAAAADLGRRAGPAAAGLVGVLEHRSRMMPPSIPLATYRLQLTPQFGFDQAAALVPYLKALGISHLYASPFLKARSGSPHGYDVVDHNSLNPELGGEEAFRRLSRCARSRGYRAHSRFRAQPHGRSLRRQSVVARCPGMGTEISLRCLIRHRLAHAAGPSARGRADSGARKLLRRGAGARRDRASLRCRGGQLLRLVLRASAADRSEPLRRDRAKGRGGGGRGRGTRGPQALGMGGALSRSAQPPAFHGAGLQGGACFDRRRQGRDRTRPARLSRRLRASGRRPRPPLPARAPALSPRRIGGLPAARSTIGASSTSTRWPGCASKTAAPSTRFMRSSAASSPKAACMDCASITSMGCATRISISAGCSG